MPDDPSLTPDQEGVSVQSRRVRGYKFDQTRCEERVRVWAVTKPGYGHSAYEVTAARVRPEDAWRVRCTCFGFGSAGHCKHCDEVTRLLALGLATDAELTRRVGGDWSVRMRRDVVCARCGAGAALFWLHLGGARFTNETVCRADVRHGRDKSRLYRRPAGEK